MQLGRDFGGSVEIVDGLSEQDRLIAAPPDGLQEGAPVWVLTPAEAARAPRS